MGLILATILTILGVTAVVEPNWVAGVINLLPAGGTLPAPVHQAANYFGNDLSLINTFLPVDTLFTIAILSYNITLILVVFWFARWVVNIVRGVATMPFRGFN